MYLIPFHSLFPEIALKETRSLTLIGYPGLPDGDYGLLEAYCPDPNCDCQRVMLNILSRSEQKQVASIGYGFDRNRKGAGPYLDPLNSQADYAPALLAAIALHLESDHAYVLRLRAHYALVKAAAANPKHPAQQVLTPWKDSEQESLESKEDMAALQRAIRAISEREPSFRALEHKTGRKKRRRQSK